MAKREKDKHKTNFYNFFGEIITFKSNIVHAVLQIICNKFAWPGIRKTSNGEMEEVIENAKRSNDPRSNDADR